MRRAPKFSLGHTDHDWAEVLKAQETHTWSRLPARMRAGAGRVSVRLSLGEEVRSPQSRGRRVSQCRPTRLRRDRDC